MDNFDDLLSILNEGKAIILCSRSTYSKLKIRFVNKPCSNIFEEEAKDIKTIWIDGFVGGKDKHNIKILAECLKDYATTS